MSVIRSGAPTRSCRGAGDLRSGFADGVRPDSNRRTWVLVTGVALVVGTACAGAQLDQSDVQSRIGRATERDIVALVPLTLERHGYIIYNNRRTSDMLYFETNWRARAPFDDEAAQGADGARTRIIIRARKSSELFFTLSLQAQNEVSGIPFATDVTGSDWSTIPATDEYREYVNALSSEIRMLVDAGQRRRR
jgi:hypothetical protein